MSVKGDQLAAQVTAALPSKRIAQLTRMDDPAFSTPDTTILNLWCAFVVAEMEATGWGEYDDDEISASLGIQGFMAYAEKMIRGDDSRWNQWREQIDTARQTRYNKRITPTAGGRSTGRHAKFPRGYSRDWTPGRPATGRGDANS